jgi:5'-methylthioadenosine phosphorylase
VVVIQGPRFSTRAESRWFSSMGWDVVGMTQYPEAILARELEMCYATLALVTDYDVGLEGQPDIKAVEASEVMRVLAENVNRVQDVLQRLIPSIPEEPTCNCQRALAGAKL